MARGLARGGMLTGQIDTCIIIHSEIIYPFNIFLFIQDLLGISLTHGSDVLYAADEQGEAKKRKRSLEL